MAKRRSYNRKKKKKVRLKVKNFILFILCIILIIYLIFGLKNLLFRSDNNIDVGGKIRHLFNIKTDEEKLKEAIEKKYNECLNEKYNENDNSEELKRIISDLDTYIYNNYRASVYYEDIKTEFTYKYNENIDYYGASLIKIVEAMYLLDGAKDGSIDLNEKLKYESKYKADFSKGMKKRKVGEKISIRNLIEYAIKYSDNTAHFMLSDYIGISNLREYEKKLGASEITITNGDSFGNQNAVDMNLYLHHAYEIINSNTEYGEFLKKIMLNNDTNALNLTDDIKIAHKYGQYDSYYHDVGIAFYDNPYYISVLTSHGNGKYLEVVNNISSKVNELHNNFYKLRKERCYNEYYGK